MPDFKREEIVCIEAIVYDEAKCEIPEDDWNKILGYLGSAEPTRKPSETDFVYSKNYRGINIKTDETIYSYFVYKEGKKTFLEIPYIGVYKVDVELFELLEDYLN